MVDDLRPGQVNTVIVVDLIDKVDDLVRSDRHVILRILAVKLDVTIGTVWTIVQNKLYYRKVRVQRVYRPAKGTVYGACTVFVS